MALGVLKKLSIGAVYLGLAALLAALGRWILEGGEFSIIVQGLLASAIILLAFSLWVNAQAVGAFLRSHAFFYGSNTLLMVLAFIGIFVVVNFVATKYYKRWDLTELKTLTLSPQTIKVLDELNSEINVIGFYVTGDATRDRANDVLQEYIANSNGKIKVRYVDPELEPALVQTYQIRYPGTLVFERGAKRQEVTGLGEAEFTSAILKVSSEKPRKAYFLTGHGERSIDSFDGQGYSSIKSELQFDNYEISTLSLAVSQTVPLDTSVLVVSDPKKDLLPEEKKALTDYLNKGGKMVATLEFDSVDFFRQIAQGLGVEIGKSPVADQQALMGDLLTPIVTGYPFSQITKDLDSRQLPTIFPLVTSAIPASSPPSGVTAQSILQTSAKSWIVTDPQRSRYDENLDVPGPISIGVSVEAEAKDAAPPGQDGAGPKARVVFIGDADFVSNTFVPALGNRDLFVNSVNWAAEAEDLISIRPKPSDERAMFLTSSEANFVFISSIAFLPLVIIVIGAAVWWARR